MVRSACLARRLGIMRFTLTNLHGWSVLTGDLVLVRTSISQLRQPQPWRRDTTDFQSVIRLTSL
jgi:hypothetical protein